MNKGDSLDIMLNFTVNGAPLEKDAYDELELQLGIQNEWASVKLLMSEGRIEFDDELGKYVAHLKQKETFQLPSLLKYQLRVRIGDDVASSDVRTLNLGDALSRKEI